MAHSIERLGELIEALAERRDDFRAGADGQTWSAMGESAGQADRLLEEFSQRATPILERMVELADEVLGPGWADAPAVGTSSAGRRAYLRRDERGRQ